MKKFTPCLCVCLWLAVAGETPAQNLNIAVQQARRDSAQNDAEQQRIQKEAGGSPGAPGATGSAPAPAPVDPALQATLKNVAGLEADFAATINSSADKPDPSQKISLLNDLSQAASGAKASAESIKKLADDLLTALAGRKKLAAAQQTKLAREIHALFNSAHLTAAQQQTLLADVQKTLTDGDAPLDNAAAVVTDLKAVVAQTK